ncbi:MAG TPA: ATP-binding protein [Tepidisphaeraceae bacterium]|jgi:anti-sigma regulatory factor (Ser/Thr protein kinase)|nr:ATP-binding protein [Tepidisphaeraceae bacterium]
MTTPTQLQLRITSDPAHLAPVRHQLEAFCAACGFDEKASGEIGLVVNEALANITRHAYGGAQDRPVELSIEFSDGVLRIGIRDWGIGRLPPIACRPRDPLKPGGVGLVCLREWMDSVTFSQQPDGMLLTLERHLPAGA